MPGLSEAMIDLNSGAGTHARLKWTFQDSAHFGKQALI